MKSQQTKTNKVKPKDEIQIREKRDREITFIHTGGQTGPRWRALLGKSGPKILVFSIFAFRYFSLYFRYLCLSRSSFCFTSETNGTNSIYFPPPPSNSQEGKEQIALYAWMLQFARYPRFCQNSTVYTRTYTARAVISGGSGSQKLEDLVRLALKRLNVSYLTEYRHVWYGLRRGRSRVSVVESKIERPFPPLKRGNTRSSGFVRSKDLKRFEKKRKGRNCRIDSNSTRVFFFLFFFFFENLEKTSTGLEVGRSVSLFERANSVGVGSCRNGLNSSKLCLSFDVTFLRLANRTNDECNTVAAN